MAASTQRAAGGGAITRVSSQGESASAPCQAQCQASAAAATTTPLATAQPAVAAKSAKINLKSMASAPTTQRPQRSRPARILVVECSESRGVLSKRLRLPAQPVFLLLIAEAKA